MKLEISYDLKKTKDLHQAEYVSDMIYCEYDYKTSKNIFAYIWWDLVWLLSYSKNDLLYSFSHPYDYYINHLYVDKSLRYIWKNNSSNHIWSNLMFNFINKELWNDFLLCAISSKSKWFYEKIWMTYLWDSYYWSNNLVKIYSNLRYILQKNK